VMPEEVIWYSIMAVVLGSCIAVTAATHGAATPVFALLPPVLKLVRDEIKDAKTARRALPVGAGP
jgi:hypothetical protein